MCAGAGNPGFATTAKPDRIRGLDAGLELVDGDHELAREPSAPLTPAGPEVFRPQRSCRTVKVVLGAA